METLYKVLYEDGRTYHGGSGSWHLPSGKRPGKWMPKIYNIEPCVHGYHVVRADQLLGWIGPAVFEVETDGETIDHGDKLVVARARLIRRTAWDRHAAVMFAADCAERVLSIYEDRFPGDDRVRKAIEAARGDDPDAAARAARAAADAADAARAAYAAARAAAYAAAYAADAARAAGAAAYAAYAADAARAAYAAYAGRAAARAARAAREWQTVRLMEYVRGER